MSKKSILITGSDGLIGSEAVKFYSLKGYSIIGIDNNSEKNFLEMMLLFCGTEQN